MFYHIREPKFPNNTIWELEVATTYSLYEQRLWIVNNQRSGYDVKFSIYVLNCTDKDIPQ